MYGYCTQFNYRLTCVKLRSNLSTCFVGPLVGKAEIGGKPVECLIQFNFNFVILVVGLSCCSHNAMAVKCPVIKCS